MAAALDAALAAFTRLGAKIVKVELPDQTALSAAALIVLAVEATSAHAPWLRTRAADYRPQVRNRLENGLAYSAIEYLEALRWRGPGAWRISTRSASTWSSRRHRVWSPPPSRRPMSAVGRTPPAAIQAVTRFMRPVNYLGLPTLVVPAGQSRQGLPIGLQLIGRPFGDDTDRARRRVPERDHHHRRMPGAAMSHRSGRGENMFTRRGLLAGSAAALLSGTIVRARRRPPRRRA